MRNRSMEEDVTLSDISYDSYSLYFKGLIKEETTGLLAGFGVAICRQESDNLLFQMKRSLHDPTITALEAELMALKRGLSEAVSLGITHISICCDHYQIFELLMGKSAPEQEKIALLMDDVQRIRQQLKSSIPVLVTGNQTKFAYKLAMETIVSEISIRMSPAPSPAQKKTCANYFDDDFETEQMSPNPTAMWRQCRKCQHMNELSKERIRVICRCGYSFCYTCGAQWKLGGCPHHRQMMGVVLFCLFLLFPFFFGLIFIWPWLITSIFLLDC